MIVSLAFVLSGLLPTTAQLPSDTVVRPTMPFDTTYSCVSCHGDKRRSFRLGVHSDRGIRCHDCHGGDPSAFEVATAHRGEVGPLSKVAITRLCARCHADPDQMRPFGLPADQLREFATSRHGELLLREGNNDAPTCTSCHDAHTILPPDDARSSVYPTNIPSTCAECHENTSLMVRYGIPTDQFRRYREGAHGTSLYEGRNFAAPTCVGCHGSHAALPPRVEEVSEVCDRCHALLRQAFYEGPHGTASLNGLMPGCISCHSNHGTERVPVDQIAATCTDCHGPDSRAAATGVALQERLLQATAELEAAQESIAELQRAGRPMTDTHFRYRTALTAYTQLAEVQHSLDLDALEDLTLRVSSISQDIVTSAEASAEHRWEHKLLLLPVWFLALAAITLAGFKLRELHSES